MGCLTPEAQTRNPAAEGQGMFGAQMGIAPSQFSAEQLFQPAYAGLGMSALEAGLFGTPGGTHSFGYTGPNGQTQTASIQMGATPSLQDIWQRWRTGQIGQVQQLGPQAAAAFGGINPQSQALLGQLNQQAAEDLGAGANLSPAVAREVAQAVRAGQSARGMGLGPADVYQEAMARGMRGIQMQDRARQFAGSVLGANQSMTVDPFLQMMGGGAPGVTAGGPRLFDPFNAYASDVYGSNQNAAQDAENARANLNSSIAANFLPKQPNVSL